MQITSKNSKLLDEIYNDLKRKNIESEKGTKKLDGGMGDIRGGYVTFRFIKEIWFCKY
jgi:hypothetical protein